MEGWFTLSILFHSSLLYSPDFLGIGTWERFSIDNSICWIHHVTLNYVYKGWHRPLCSKVNQVALLSLFSFPRSRSTPSDVVASSTGTPPLLNPLPACFTVDLQALVVRIRNAL
jgi:hypothetical protein